MRREENGNDRTRLMIGLAAALMLQAGGLGFAQGNGNGRRPGEESTMNLSYPAKFYQTPLQSGVIGSFLLNAAFPSGMSYGCAVPEKIGTTTFPNTSCVDETGIPLTPEQCTCLDAEGNVSESCDTARAKCLGKPHSDLERIYWQKTTQNQWQAGYETSGSPLPVEYVDWGDNLEGKTWPVQILRVETNTFSSLETNTFSSTDPRLRFDMWHVFGQGTTELWGAHATNPDTGAPVPFVYEGFPFAVNVTAEARLNLSKLESGASACPTTATGVTQSPFEDDGLVFTPTPPAGWSGSVYTRDILYGVELNIKGSYVYGFNWNVRNEPVPTGISRAGWWRLTFYAPDNSLDFSKWVGPSAGLAPPLSDLAPAPLMLSAESESETGLKLYVPQVDTEKNLTYLDICIQEGKAGGGRRR